MNTTTVKDSLTVQPSDTPLTDALDAAEREIDRALDFARTLERELAAAIEQRDKARNDALEEAAKICDEYANKGVVGARICAAAICATKEFGAHIAEMHEFIAENQRAIDAAMREEK